MSLSDSLGNGRAQLNSNLSRMRNASIESSRRNPGGRVWIERNKAIGYPFFMKAKSTLTAIFLDDPEPFLAHAVIRNWEEMNDGTGFATRDHAVCTQFTLGVDGTTYEPTGKPCLFCSIVGQPRLLVAGKIYVVYDEPIIRKDKTQIKTAVLPVLFNQEEVTNQIIDAASSDIGQGSLKGCAFRVTRTDKPKSPRIGDSWAIQKRLDQVVWNREMPALKPKIDAIDFTKGFSPMTLDEQRAALRTHKSVADNKLKGEGYNHPEYVQYVEKEGVPNASNEAAPPANGWTEGGLAGALSIADGNAPAAEEPASKSLFDLTDSDFLGADVPTKEEPAVAPTTVAKTEAPKTEVSKTTPPPAGGGLWT